MIPTESSAHGKLILLGEHSVVYGEPALAMPSTLSLTVSAGRPGFLDIPELGFETTWQQSNQMVEALLQIFAPYVDLAELGLTVTGDLPSGVGLGYSAALSLGVARYLDQLTGYGTQVAIKLAGDLENLFHGGASGLDLAACASNGAIRFIRGVPPQVKELILPTACSHHLLVAVFPVTASTKELVGAVRNRMATDQKQMGSLIRELGELTLEGEPLLLEGKGELLGRVCTEVQQRLTRIGVSTGLVDQAVERALIAGASGAKLSGAGGGGAVFAVVDAETQSAVRQSWEELQPIQIFVQPLQNLPLRSQIDS